MPIASGVYTHYENSHANGITEHWQQDTISSLAITFNTPAYTMTIAVTFDNRQRVADFTYHVDSALQGRYRVQASKLQVERNLPPNIKLADTLIWSDDTILDLPFLSTKGHTILQLDTHGIAPVFAPHLRSGDRAGDLAKKSAENLGTDTLIIANKSYPATKFRYGHLYWINNEGVVLRVQTDNYEMVLTEYTRFDSEF